ncbi:MAG: DUF4349 domain-containing protein [Anaerolineales bacterium]|nr:DUF4349 domain-containing protein [Anaerolineales bacterium]
MKRTLFVILGLSLMLTACMASPASKEAMPADWSQGIGSAAPDMMVAEAPMEMQAMTDEVRESNNSYTDEAVLTQRMVIQNADLSIVAVDPQEKMAAIVKLAEKLDGWVVSSNQYQSYTHSGNPVPEGNITIRVPADKMNQALDQIKADAVEVISENRSGEDVTKEYIDLKSRLKNLEAAEGELTEIMENAKKTEDVLSTFEQLTYYREQIEVVKGQMQYYEESVAMSAISVRLIAEETVEPIEVGGWKLEGTTRDAAQALINFFQGFVRFLIWLVILIIPVGVILLILLWALWLLFRFVWRKLFPKKPKPETPPTEKK